MRPRELLGLPWGTPGAPMGHIGGIWSGTLFFGRLFGLNFGSNWCLFEICPMSCLGCGFRHGFGTLFSTKNENPSYVKNVDLAIHVVKHI